MGQKNPVNHNKSTDRIVRYDDLVPCYDAFIDTRTPGSDKKENFTIIGPGVSENPNQHVHIAEPHGFNIGGARQPPGCVNSQHSHDTAEVFFVHSGVWSFDMGEDGTDATITLRPGDMISIPTRAFRGFKNVGDDIGYLWAVLGQDNPGKVLWAPDVFDMAKNYGLVLLESGLLIDTAKGETIPAGAKVMAITNSEQIAALQTFSDENLRNCCILAEEGVAIETRGLVTQRKLIGPTTKLNWEHWFSVDQFSLSSGGETDPENHSAPEVVFVHEGEVTVRVGQEDWELGPGDTATIPKLITRQYLNMTSAPATLVRVRVDD